MATLPELRPNGDVSTTTSIPWVNDGADTLMWQAIDDDPDSPDAADYADSDIGLYAGTAVLELASTPADFDSMDSISIAGFFMKTGARVDDDVTFWVKIANAGDTSDFVVETQIAASDAGGDDTGLQAVGSVTAAGISASKADWDAARLHIRVLAVKDKSWDSGTFGFQAIEVRGEYTAGVTDWNIEPTDEAVTVGDTATVDPLLLADVSEQDDVTVVDTPTVEIGVEPDPDVSEQDDITVGDTATMVLSDPEISEAENLTVGDTETLDPLLLDDISESDAVTVGDTATLSVSDPEISESENVTVGEVFWQYDDHVTVADTPTVQVPTEDVWSVSEQDDITVGDTATVDPVLLGDVSELDAVTVGDTPTVNIPSAEEWSVSEQDDVTVGDTPTVGLLAAETLGVSELDPITVGDTPNVSVPEATALDVSETDPITVDDTATLGPVTPTEIDELDDITVTDTPTVLVPEEDVWYVSEADAVTVGETVALYLATDVSELDAVTVGDTATITLDLGEISELDAVTVTDTPTLGAVTPTDVSVLDSVIVVDTPTVAFFQPVLSLSVADAVSLTELVDVGFPSDILGLDKTGKKPYEYQRDMLVMEPIVRPLDPAFALRQEQKSVMKANAAAEALVRQNEQAAADRVSAMLSREKVDKDKADRRRASSLHNLAKAQIAKETKAQKQAEINKARKKNLQKARAAKKRKAKKK